MRTNELKSGVADALKLLRDHRDSIHDCAVNQVSGAVPDDDRANIDRHQAACDAIENQIAETAELRRARADLAAKYDELLVALHGIGRALGIEEADRSPYSITCGVLAMANRLAEIEAQKPSMYVLRSTAGSVRPTVVTRTSLLSCAQADRVDAGEDHLDPLFARSAPSAAPEREEGGAPHVDDAYYMGATGGEATDGERLAFESWMRGHCWALCATWNGTAYRSDAEQGGNIDPRAMRTRQLWAAWRDRAALASLKAPNAYGARQPAGTHAQDQRRPCRCGPDGRSDSTSCPRGER